MLTASTPEVYNKTVQAIMPKSIIPDLEWFDSNWMKFEDQWRGIQLFLKSNRVIATDDKITAVLAQLKEDITEIYIQKKSTK